MSREKEEMYQRLKGIDGKKDMQIRMAKGKTKVQPVVSINEVKSWENINTTETG